MGITIKTGLISVFLISFLPLFDLLTSGLPITHDSIDHIARIANFYKNLSEGTVIPRWAGDLNLGFGHPILIFLYPLPSYFASLFHFFGTSYVDSFKLVLGVSYILSGIFMYLWLVRFLGILPAVLGSIFYLFAPYRFVDLYVRGAIGEHAAFTFMPLVLFALFLLNNISKKSKVRKYYFGFLFLSMSFAGLILSHNAISLLFIPFILFYSLYLFNENKSKIKLILSGFSLLLGFLLSFFFWFPAFFEGKYTLRDIVTAGEYSSRFVNLSDLIYSPWSYGTTGQFSVQIGIVQMLILAVSVLLFFKIFKKRDKLKYLFIAALIYFFVSVFLMLPTSSFIYETFTTLQKLQFPWRFLSVVVFSVSLIGALFVCKIDIKKKGLLTFLLVLLAVIPTITFWQAKEYKVFDDSYFEKVYRGTTDTGESSPIWSIRFMEQEAEDQIEIIEGEGQIVKLPRTSTRHEYVMDISQRSRIRENTLYFPGWKVYDNGKLLEDIEFQDPKNRGIITFNLEEGMHNIIMRFEETKLRNVSNLVSFFTIITLLLIPPILIFKPKTIFKNLKW